MKSSEILRKAAEFLKKRKSANSFDGLCFAITCVSKEHWWKKEALHRHIEKLLGIKHAYLPSWLVEQGHMTSLERSHLANSTHIGKQMREKLRQTRINWALHLAAEYEAKGD